MGLVQKIFLACGCALAVSVVCEGAALNSCMNEDNIFDTIDNCLYKNDNEPASLGASFSQNSPSLFDAIFDSGALKDYTEELSKDIEEILKQVCWLNYRENSVIDLNSKSEDIRDCMDVSERDIRSYFRKHNQEKFETGFNNYLKNCTSSTNRSAKLMNCYVDTTCKYLKKIEGGGGKVSTEEERCVRSKFESYVSKTTEFNDEHTECFRKVDDRKKKN